MIYSSQKLLTLPDGWKTFAEHRVVRIVPLYWLVTTLKLLIVLFTAGLALHTVLNPTTAACSYLFLPARDLDGKLEPLVGVGWTLNFEMFFYFLFAVALFLRKNVLVFAGIVLSLLSAGSYFRNPAWPPVASFYLNSMVLEFYFGMLIAKACMHGIWIQKRYASVLLACGLFLLISPPENNWHLSKALINGLPASLIVWSVASLRLFDSGIPRWVLYLGDASYAIYLIHPFVSPIPPVILSRFRFDSPSLSVVLSVAIGLGAGCVLHEFVELPMTNWLKGSIKARRRALAVGT